jgi:hypothetical protein
MRLYITDLSNGKDETYLPNVMTLCEVTPYMIAI